MSSAPLLPAAVRRRRGGAARRGAAGERRDSTEEEEDAEERDEEELQRQPPPPPQQQQQQQQQQRRLTGHLSDGGAVWSEDEAHRPQRGRGKIQARLPMIPSRARFPTPSTTLPRQIPRRLKGHFRRIVAHQGEEEEEQPLRRLAVYCPSNQMDLDGLYAALLRVQERAGRPIAVPDEFSRFENNQTILVVERPAAAAAVAPSRLRAEEERDTIESAEWTASIFFDVLHLRQLLPTREAPAAATPTAAAAAAAATEPLAAQEEHEDPYANREVFLFGFGVIVLWNFESAESEQRFVRSVEPHCKSLYPSDLSDAASDDLEFFYGDKHSVRHDTIEVGSADPMERLAVSFAVAQSSLLSVYELRLDKVIARNEHIPVQLATHGKVSLNGEQIGKEIGLLFLERNKINLDTDVTRTPDIFWENDEREPIYRSMGAYLELEERHESLNKRLDCVRELLDVLASQVEAQHGAWLEVIIIWLIAIEVIVAVGWQMIIKDILGYFNH